MDRKFQKVLDLVLDLLEAYMYNFGQDAGIYCVDNGNGVKMIFVGEADIVNNVLVPKRGFALFEQVDCIRLLDQLRKMHVVEKVNITG